MTNKTQSILIFILMAIVIGLIIVWFYVLNYGKVLIATGLNNYIIYTDNEITECLMDPCEIKLKVGDYQIRFEKEGYNTVFTTTKIIRGTINEINLDPKKTMKIESINVVPKTDRPTPPIPKDLNTNDIISHTWNNNNDKILFLDKSDERLKIKKPDGEIDLITVLKNILSPISLYWSPDEQYIIANQENDIYYIETKEGSRKKNILNFIPKRISWSPASDFFLINDDENNLYKIKWGDYENINKIDIILNLNESAWINTATLITYATDKENNLTTIWTYDPSTLIRERITQKFDFPLDKINYDPVNETVYFHHSREGGWYKMEMW